MSYMSGFMLGTALGENLHRLMSPKPYGKPKAIRSGFVRFKPVSIQEGRRRYITDRLSPELAKALEEKLPKLTFISEVRANPQTGSVLFIHNGSEKQMDALAAYLKGFVFCNAAEKNSTRHLKQGNITRSIRSTTGEINRWLKKSSGNNIDLTAAASLLFIALGIRKSVTLKQTPTGPQMLWWAVSLLRGWRD